MFRPLNIFFVLLLFFLWASCVFAGDVPPVKGAETQLSQAANAQEAPVIQVSEPTFDFGETMESEEISHDFIVKNAGKAVLQIDKVSPG